MERLISFLMNNIVFVIIVIGIIYSMFFRKSPLERPPNRMPDFGGGGFPRPQRPGERKPPGPPARHPATDETGFPAPRPAVPPVTRSEPRTPLSVEAAPVLSQSAAIVAGEISGLPDSANEGSSRALSREDLTRAVVWAEILGPPRSRRPHRR